MSFLTTLQLDALSFKRPAKNVHINDKAVLYSTDYITTGEPVRIDDFCVNFRQGDLWAQCVFCGFFNMAGGTENLTLEDFSGLTPGCPVFSKSDEYTGRSLTNCTVPAAYEGVIILPLVIGRYCIIGWSPFIFPGLVLGEGCTAGAMSMGTLSTEQWNVYFSCFAGKLKVCKRDMLAREHAYLD